MRWWWQHSIIVVGKTDQEYQILESGLVGKLASLVGVLIMISSVINGQCVTSSFIKRSTFAKGTAMSPSYLF
eukprot:scaffold25133_cov70-Cyclotella_meneghiniana.AAC.2